MAFEIRLGYVDQVSDHITHNAPNGADYMWHSI